MYDGIFILTLAGIIVVLFTWAFRALPEENWQVLACVPRRKGPDGVWQGVNFTFYGFFDASAHLFAVVMFLIMTGSLDIRIAGTLSFVIPLLTVCLFSSRLIARLVENKRHTFSIGGASFTGILIAPWMILLVNMTLGGLLEFHLPVLEMLAAIFIAYCFGEGTGRLACLSFGCCYGKPLDQCHPLIQKIFRKRHMVFRGSTKKIAYAHNLEGRAVVPVQALTAVLYTATGLLSFYLFLKGFAKASLIIALVVTQGWRFASEFMRADYRGNGFISAYQIMALFGIGYILLIMPFIKEFHKGLPNLMTGIESLWSPGMIIFLMILWVIVFLYNGRSTVTGSSIDIRVIEENI